MKNPPNGIGIMDQPPAPSLDEMARRSLTRIKNKLMIMSGYTCPHCGKSVDIFGDGGGERTALQAGLKLLGRIPFDPKLVACGDAGISFRQHYTDAPATSVFDDIAAQVALASQD